MKANKRYSFLILIAIVLSLITSMVVANTVNNLSLKYLAITPVAPVVAHGAKLQLTAVGDFSDNTGAKATADLTQQVNWHSSDTAVATIDQHGLVHGLQPGSTTIIAAYAGITATVKLVVTKAVLASLQIKPNNAKAVLGVKRQFTAIGIYSNDTKVDLTKDVFWTSSNKQVAKISNSSGSRGLATTLALGKTIISAAITHAGVTLSATQVFTVTNAVVVAVTITPATASQAKGRSQQFTATGTMSDQTTEDLTAAVAWTSSDQTIATINAQGNATIQAASGTVMITATDPNTALSDQVLLTVGAPGQDSDKSAPVGLANLTATPAVVAAINVTPVNASQYLGGSSQFYANATMTDNTTQNITNSAIWSSSNPSVAVIDAAGRVTTKTTGQAVITAATISPDGFMVVSNNALLTVSSARVTAINIAPANASQPCCNLTQQFIATGTMSDNTTQNLTNLATWSSSNATIASINTTSGLVTTQQVGGPITIRATTNNTINGTSISSDAAFTVTDAILQAINIIPANSSIANGLSQPFTAQGRYSNNTTQNLTDELIWSSSNATIAAINASTGVAVAQAVGGPVIITVTDNNTSISGSTSLNVTAASLQDLKVTPTTPSMAQGLRLSFTATGIYSDNTMRNVTSAVTWTSDNKTVVTIDGTGNATAIAPGSATITATDSGTLISNNTPLTVTNATLRSLQITPVNPKIARGAPLAFTATGTYSDNTTQNLTNQVIWMSDNASIATIDTAGKALAKAIAGAVNITAVAPNNSLINNSTALTVTNATLTAITVTPANSSKPLGLSQQFSAVGTYNDGTTQDLTTVASWGSSDQNIIAIDSSGNATTQTNGTVTISAAAANCSSSAVVFGSTLFTAVGNNLTSIEIKPLKASQPLGAHQQFNATGIYDDNSTYDLTTVVDWASNNTIVASIDKFGNATTLATGLATITATYPNNTSINSTASLNVTNATV